MMAVIVMAIVAQRNLFSVVVLASIYSFLMASVLVALDAVDVAMTEASVGAGISTVLLLSALYLTKGEEAKAIPIADISVGMEIMTSKAGFIEHVAPDMERLKVHILI